MVHTIRKLLAKAALFTLGIKLSSLAKASFIVGSYMAFFSMTNVMAPLSGAFCGTVGSSFVCAIRLLVSYLVYGLPSLHLLSNYIPGLFAAWCWSTRSVCIHVGVPVLCMILFMFHPVGMHAFVYALFWLIPIALFFVPQKNIFLQAVASTFVAHAVGSVIWLYTVPMEATTWLGLMPIVIIERLLFATGMVVMHRAISWSISTLSLYFARALRLPVTGSSSIN